MTLKEKIYTHCVQLINNKINEMQTSLNELNEGLTNDSKSSAGDKYETSRAMQQIEQEKLMRQLHEAKEQKDILEKIDITANSKEILKGSLVKTNSLLLFIGAAIGKITIDGTAVMVLSPQSPLGIKLMGLKAKDSTTINGVNYFIESVE